MVKSSQLLFYAIILTSSLCFSQTQQQKKVLQINRSTNKAPKIDGLLDDDAWKNIQVAKDFVMRRPNNGEKELQTHKTEVKVIYDDEAIYISAMLYDNEPSKIAREFTNRDNFGQADFFNVTINPNNDGLNTTQFIVMSTGTQADASVSNGREDFNWSAVWESAVNINERGWSVEIKIPYAALRFSNQEVQTWGINFFRRMVRQNAQYSWNHVDNTKGIWTQYDGVLEGIKNINPPTRLSFYPYASTTANHYNGSTEYSHNLGMDLKYGITENFTLDLTLIPDFGQTAFDNVQLNLGPFEQRFSEQRQFFTEGTELFNKGRMFYSRRIGNRPVGFYDAYDNLADNEEVIDNPGKVNMLNAIKISGRTKNGLGVGFFNAITDVTKATIKKTITHGNTTTEEYYQRITEPLANYNVFVLDQQFNKNSTVSLVNTNVLREGSFRDANVTGLLYHLATKENTYFIDGYLKKSTIKDNGTKESGYAFDTSIAKIAGNWQGEIGYNMEDDKFNFNDLGFQRRNNKQTIYSILSYRILKPVGNFNNLRVNLRVFNSFLYKPGTYTGNSYRLGFFANTKERFSFGVNLNGSIGKNYDYFEPRRNISERRFLTRDPRINFNGFISTDFRKQFAFDLRGFVSKMFNTDQKGYGFNFAPRYRFNNKFSLVYSFDINNAINTIGYVTNVDIDPNTEIDNINNPIIFGKRKRESVENGVTGKYSFSTNSSLSLSFRHLWTTVKYNQQFYSLNNNGYLSEHNYIGDHNQNYNSWNLDVNYLWQFAPGSQLIAFYRNNIFSSGSLTNQNFFTNLNNLLKQPAAHTFSLKFVYFIDYNKIKQVFNI